MSWTRQTGGSSHMGILGWIILGGLAGWLASRVVRGSGLGLLGDIVVGIVGAILGGLVLSLLLPGTFGFTGFNFGSLVVAFVGAVILLVIVRLIGAGRRTTV